jgi:predicted transcriptional regulator
MRKQLNLTQKELADLAGVSRSWIAKVETRPKALSPSYAQTKRVFDELEKQQKMGTIKMKSMMSPTARDIHNTNIVYAESSEMIREVWNRMGQNCFSQFPVKESERIVGSLTERGVNKKIMEVNQGDFRNMKVKDVMDNPFPTVNVETPVFAIVPLLQIYQAVMTADGPKVVGIVTNTDLGKIFERIWT